MGCSWKAGWADEARKLVLACVVGRTFLNEKPEISTWTLTCLTQAGEGCRLIFEFGSFVGPARPNATDISNTRLAIGKLGAAQCTLAGPGPVEPDVRCDLENEN